MKRVRIFHETEYLYHSPVILGYHKLLIRPRDGHDIRIESSKLDISPDSLVSWHRDELDNSVALVTFDDTPVSRLIITSEVVVAHYLSARTYLPLDPHVSSFPFRYSPSEQNLLAAYFDSSTSHPRVAEWTESVVGMETSTEAILHALTRSIYEQCTYQLRDEEGVQTPEQTLALSGGSCRDYAWLFVTATRSLGFASRFVSGYFNTEGTPLEDGNTHAWAEVYLPGAGWTGFDPTSNQVSAENHIPVSVAINPEAIPPVSGMFTGPPGETPSMQIRVSVHPV